MDALIAAAARALAAGDTLAALNLVALRDDAPGLALRGVAMAQLGDVARGGALLRRATRAFAPHEVVARARAVVAEAEIALVSRDLGRRTQTLASARATLDAHGDRTNAAHAGALEARRLLLLGRLGEAERTLDGLAADALPPASRTAFHLVAAGIAMRRIRAAPARAALARAARTARSARIPALCAEVDRAVRLFEAPAARLLAHGGARSLRLAEVERLLDSDTLVVDACRRDVRAGRMRIPLRSRPVLFTLARLLAEAWPEDESRGTLLARTFRAHAPDDSYRARLRVEIGRLRTALRPLARLHATPRGFALEPSGGGGVVVLAPPVEGEHVAVLALLADGEAWSSSALALALGVSARTVQRVLESLARAGAAEPVGRGRARRWTAPSVPGFPTSLLLPTTDPDG